MEAAVNTFVNLTLSVLPGFIVWNLRLQRATKISIVAIISVSILAAVASVIKTLALADSEKAKLPVQQVARYTSPYLSDCTIMGRSDR